MDLTKRIKDSNQRRKRGFEPKNFFSWLADHGDPSSDDIAEVGTVNFKELIFLSSEEHLKNLNTLFHC